MYYIDPQRVCATAVTAGCYNFYVPYTMLYQSRYANLRIRATKRECVYVLQMFFLFFFVFFSVRQKI